MPRTVSHSCCLLLLIAIHCLSLGQWSSAIAQELKAQEAKSKALREPRWVEPDESDANGAKYHKFASQTLRREVSYQIYLPPQYDEHPSRRFPVIYWLHGLGGNQRGGTLTFLPQVKQAIGDSSLPPTIVVFVNGMVSSFYCDWPDGQRPMESIIVKDLIPHIDATYRTIARREARAIEGYSMGGYGAGHLGFKYPELFGTVVIDAGALLQNISGRGRKTGVGFAGAWGGDQTRFDAEHPKTLVAKNVEQIRGKQNIRIACGGDDGLLPRNRELDELLTKLNINHQFEVVDGIAHNAALYYAKLGTQGLAIHRQAFEKLSGDGN
jgi:endo-1,4-beta-xylanase